MKEVQEDVVNVVVILVVVSTKDAMNVLDDQILIHLIIINPQILEKHQQV
jgi:hypothetical protein